MSAATNGISTLPVIPPMPTGFPQAIETPPPLTGGIPMGYPSPMFAPQMALPMQGVGGLPMLPGQAQGLLGAAAMKPPSTIGTVIKSIFSTGLIGAAIGAGIGAIPFLPGGVVTGALIGGVAGAALGLVRGIGKAKHDKAQYEAITRGLQTPPLDPAGLTVATRARRARKKVRKAGMKKSGTPYTIRSGDTLSSIAARHHTTWQKIYAANRAAIGSNPSRIQVGVKLVVPADRA